MISDSYTASLARENARLNDGLAELENLISKLATINDDLRDETPTILAFLASGHASIALRRIKAIRGSHVRVIEGKTVAALPVEARS